MSAALVPRPRPKRIAEKTRLSGRVQRLYTRLSAAEVSRQLVKKNGYHESTAPSAETIRVKLNVRGYHPARVAKTKPKKRSRKPTPSLTP